MPKKDNVVCVYNYYPVNEQYTSNLDFFLRFGSGTFDHVYVSYPKGSQQPLLQSDRTTFIPVVNRNNDYGSLCSIMNSELREFSGPLFVANSSVRGPYFDGLDSSNWLSHYVTLLSDQEGIAGDSMNLGRRVMPHSIDFGLSYKTLSSARHIQTTNFLLSSKAQLLLREKGFFQERELMDKRTLIREFEIKLSTTLIDSGMAVFEVRKHSSKSVYSLGHFVTGDPHTSYLNFGKAPSPSQKFFLKTNRGLYTDNQLREFDQKQINKSKAMGL